MPFLTQGSVPIPEKDIISWYFDEPQFDQDKPIYLDATNPKRNYTWRTARRAIRQLNAGFRAAGLQQGDCVCLSSFNELNYPIVINGIVAFGGVFTGTNPAYQPFELIHHMKTAKVKALIVEPELLKPVLEAADAVGIVKERIFVFDNQGEKIADGLRSWRTLFEHGEQDWTRLSGQEAKTRTAARLFSSGTTGLPKAAELSHYNLIAQHTMVNHKPSKDYGQVSRLVPLPMFHAAAVPSTHFAPLFSGDQIYVMRRFDLIAFLEGIQRLRISDLTVVPPMAIAIIMSEASRKYDLTSLKRANCGAAPLDAGAQARLQALMKKGSPFTQVWGMTETSCVCSQFSYPEDDVTGSVGYMLPGVDAKLVDDDGKDISDYDVRGEICVRGPNVISGYFENPEANARDWDDNGYFHTGDVGYCSKETKKWYIVDRKKELIKVRAFQVAPPELEAVLLAHPHIIDAAVIGIDSADGSTQLPRAYVVRRATPEGESLTEQDVYDIVKGKLTRYKWLEGGVKFLPAVPKNPSGKILKRVLREQAKKEIGAKL